MINNSWGRTNAGLDSVCQAVVVAQALLSVEAAGIANVFSAGNSGPGPYTIGVPAQVIYDSLNVF
ncbi:MAG: S8 family serine peptidase, partial [Bacteroidota bacterium]